MNDALSLEECAATLEAYAGPDALSVSVVDLGNRADGVLTFPSVSYLPVVGQMWASLRAAGFDSDAGLDYLAWEDRFGQTPERAEAIADMSLDDLAHFIVKCRRGERFCDGYWGSLIAQGVMLAVIRRALALRGDSAA